MEAFGAEIIIVEQAEGAVDGQGSGEDMALVEEQAAEIVSRRGAFRVDQFRREGNILAHERHTGPELWAQSQGQIETIASLPGGWDLAHAIRLGIKPFAELGANSEALSGSQVDSPCSCRAIFESAPVVMLQSRQIDVFLDTVGTCGSFTGVARSLRGLNPTVRTYAVEPAGAAVLGGGCVSNPRHRIQGAGYARTDLDLFDKTIAFLACDSGLKYLSTDLFP